MYGAQATTGQGSSQQGGQDSSTENKEVFQEAEVAAKGKEVADKSLEKFKSTQTCKNINTALIKECKVQDKTIGLPINQKLSQRISTESVNMDISSPKFEDKFGEYSEQFFPGVNFQSITESRKDFYKQSLGIIVACCESSIVNLNKSETKELCDILLPLVSKSKVGLAEIDQNEDKEVEKTTTFDGQPEEEILLRCRNDGIISQEEFDVLNEQYAKKGNFEDIDFLIHSEAVKDLLEKVRGHEKGTTKLNQTDFLNDFQNQEIGTIEIDIENDITAKLISESYVQIKKPGEHTHDKWADYTTALRVAKNKLMLGDRTVDRELETYKKAVLQLKSDDLVQQYKGFSTIIGLKDMRPGQLTQVEKLRKTRLEELLEKSITNRKKRIENQKGRLAQIGLEEDAENDEEYDQQYNETFNGEEGPLSSGDIKTETISSNTQSSTDKAA